MLFYDWMDELNKIAIEAGHHGHQDRDSWRDDFEDGKTPQEAWSAEWGDK